MVCTRLLAVVGEIEHPVARKIGDHP